MANSTAFAIDGQTISEWPKDQPFSPDLLEAVIRRHAPVIHFHPEESFFPSDIEWFLDRALLVDGKSGAVLKRHPAPADLPQGPADPSDPEAMWLTFDRDLAGPAIEPHLAPADDPRRGNLDRARAYVRAVHHAHIGATDLQFWMFYPFDGPGLVRLRPAELGAVRADKVLSLWPGGMHEGDWEMATLRIDHADLAPSGLILSQHKDGDLHLTPEAMRDVERDGDGRIRLYSSLYAHASYAHVHERKVFYLWKPLVLIGIELGLVDRIAPGGTWNLGEPGNHQVVSTSWNDPAFPEPSWLQFAWRWGAYDPKGGRFSRQLVEGLKALLEGRMATSVLVLHLATLGISALLFALAPLILGGGTGARLLGSAADNSGPVGPRWQLHKWNGLYGFSGPPAPISWRKPGSTLAQRLTALTNAVCHPPVRLVSAVLGLFAAPFLPKS